MFQIASAVSFLFSLPDHMTDFSSIHGQKTVVLTVASNERPVFPIITNTSNGKHHQQQFQRRRSDIRTGAMT